MSELWIHFDFLCDLDTQIKLHKIFRSKISEWCDADLVTRSVLTYHYNYPHRDKCDSLYLCLEIPSVRLPSNRSNLVPEETLKQIPVEIRSITRQMTLEYLTNLDLDKLEVIDYEWELISCNASKQYKNAPIEEILRFASKGTEIALEILNSNKTRNRTWETDRTIVNSINKRIQENLVSDREQDLGLHFVCNSACLAKGIETIIRRISTNQIDGNGQGILEFLYEIERTGNFEKARQHFLKEYG